MKLRGDIESVIEGERGGRVRRSANVNYTESANVNGVGDVKNASR